jgi:PAS domain S-box-containing protein
MPNPDDYKALWEAEKARSLQLETELEYARQRSASIFDNAGDSIFIVNSANLTVADANENASRRLGYTREALIGMSLDDLEVDMEPSAVGSNMSWESSFSGTRVYECYHRHKDGQLIPVEVSSRAVKLMNRDVIVIFTRSIELRKLVQQRELEITLEQERLKLLSTFIQNASHEFRTPLTVITTSLYLLPRLEDVEKRQQKRDVIQAQVDRITSLVDMLLLMAKVESTPLSTPEPISIMSVVMSAVDSLRAKHGDAPLLTLHLPPDLPEVMGDSELLITMISQIIDNAYRFTDEAGSITLGAAVRDADLSITIQDTGSGIASEDLPRVFETFWRKNAGHTHPGFGVGLTIAQKIAQQHKGRIEIESVPGQGTTVRIRLPLTSQT